MTSPRESELRAAVAVAGQRVASLRAAVAQARLDADPRGHRRRTVACLVMVGALGLGGSSALGRHLTSEERARADQLVIGAHDEELFVDQSATNRCTTERTAARRQAEECSVEVMALQPHARARVPRECRCMTGDPLCECP